jgi:hypothetical protein
MATAGSCAVDLSSITGSVRVRMGNNGRSDMHYHWSPGYLGATPGVCVRACMDPTVAEYDHYWFQAVDP